MREVIVDDAVVEGCPSTEDDWRSVLHRNGLLQGPRSKRQACPLRRAAAHRLRRASLVVGQRELDAIGEFGAVVEVVGELLVEWDVVRADPLGNHQPTFTGPGGVGDAARAGADPVSYTHLRAHET